MPSALLSCLLLPLRGQESRQKHVTPTFSRPSLPPQSGSAAIKSRRKIPLDATHAITHALPMQTVTATTARSMIYKLLDDASDSHEPIQITGKRSSAVLVAEDDWRAIQESLYLVSIPGMRESIRAGLATPVSACAKKLDW